MYINCYGWLHKMCMDSSIKRQKGETVANAFEEIMKILNRKPNRLWVDQGKKFYNQHMYKLLKFKTY